METEQITQKYFKEIKKMIEEMNFDSVYKSFAQGITSDFMGTTGKRINHFLIAKISMIMNEDYEIPKR